MLTCSNEKEFLAKEIAMLKVQLEERHSNHEELLQSMKNMEQSKEEMQEANRILSDSMKKSDERSEKAK